MGMRYTIITNKFSYLMMYFLIQTLASFILLLSYIYVSSFLFTISLMLKLGIFPFFLWFIRVVYNLPNLIFFFSISFHKLPIIVLLFNFNLRLNYELLHISIILSVLVRGLIIIRTLDLRILLLISSIGNNVWFIILQMVSIYIFLLYMVFYILGLFIIIVQINNISSYNISENINSQNLVNIYILYLSGLPPFPLFFLKMLLIYNIFVIRVFNVNFVILLFLFSFIMCGYFSFLFSFYFIKWNNVTNIFLKV